MGQILYNVCYVFAAKLVETGTYAGDEDDDVLFDDMVDDYEDEDEAIDAVSSKNINSSPYSTGPVSPLMKILVIVAGYTWVGKGLLVVRAHGFCIH